MAIQMRRGLEADFNPDKMKPGEWAVSLDKKYVRMCFAPGLCFRMATYESFEEDMQEIQNILASVNSTKEDIDAIKLVIDEKSTLVTEKTEQASQYADVATQKAQEATDASNSASESAANANTYAANASNSADIATTKATEASQSASNANASSESASNSAETATLKANDANTSATNARNSADIAQSNATLSKSYAVGGTGTREGEDTDNAKYYYEQTKAVTNVDIATTEKAGIVKPDGTSVAVDPDGTIHAQTGTNIETLSDIGDVDIQNPQDKQALVYDSETQTWKNGQGSVSPIDNLTSNSTTEPLSANQGRVLNNQKLEKEIISDEWNASITYAVGQYCIHNNILWKCLVANTNTEPTEGTHWTKVSVANEIASVNSSLEGIVFGIPDYSRATTIITPTSTSKVYTLPEDGFIYYMVSGNSTLMITATINNDNTYRFGGRAETNHAVGGMVYMPKGTPIKAISSSSEYVLKFIPLK